MQMLIDHCKKRRSLLCLGLDADASRLPERYLSEEDPVLAYNRDLIDATVDQVAAFKPNFAFYEALGVDGLRTLQSTIAHIGSRALVIGDAKRGDIGNTSARYARLAFKHLGCHTLTLAPYMGHDSLRPFLDACPAPEKGLGPGMGAFVLALTSNPGADDFQFLDCQGRPLYLHVLERIQRWNQEWASGRLGAVVGATRPGQLEEIRREFPAIPLLIPGIGAQGGDLEATLKAILPLRESAALINVSRGILFGSDTISEPQAAGERARAFNEKINVEPWWDR